MSIGFWQIAIVVVLVVLLFGRGKISALMGDVAKGIKSFKKGMSDNPDNTNDTEEKIIQIKTKLDAQIGWFELLIIILVAIIIVGPKVYSYSKKIGSWIGSVKKYFRDIQSSVDEYINRWKTGYKRK